MNLFFKRFLFSIPAVAIPVGILVFVSFKFHPILFLVGFFGCSWWIEPAMIIIAILIIILISYEFFNKKGVKQ
jgi:hypothetical protein